MWFFARFMPPPSRRRQHRHFVRPYLETGQRVDAEGVADRHVGGVAAAGDQDAALARRVVARIEHVPAAVEPGLEPGREIHGRVGWRFADVAEITGAVA